MRIVEIAEAPVWDGALLELPNPHVLQSWTWGEFKARHGWQVSRLLFQSTFQPEPPGMGARSATFQTRSPRGGRTVAAVSILERRLPHLPVSILYAPKGPLLDWTDSNLAAEVLGALEDLARHRRALLLKIDPDLYYPDAAPAFAPRPARAPQIAEMLAARGWRFSGEQVQFRNTVLLDLARPAEEILAAMKQTPRRNVRLARRRGVAVRRGDAADFEAFYRLYAETARRQGFVIRPPDYYFDAWGSFLAAGLAHLLLAEFEGEVIAGLMLFTFGPTAWYMYGASSGRYRRQMPNQLLQWEAIRRAQAVGCTLYDLWGAPDPPLESDPLWGVYRFKLGLGGQLARGLGAWDYPVHRLGYRFYAGVLPRYLDWLRRRSK